MLVTSKNVDYCYKLGFTYTNSRSLVVCNGRFVSDIFSKLRLYYVSWAYWMEEVQFWKLYNILYIHLKKEQWGLKKEKVKSQMIDSPWRNIVCIMTEYCNPLFCRCKPEKFYDMIWCQLQWCMHTYMACHCHYKPV